MDGRILEESLVFGRKSFFRSRKAQPIPRIGKGEHLSPAHFNVVVKQPRKKMFWGSISFSGVGSLMPIGGMMSSDKYIDVIENKVIPDMRRAFFDGGGIFHQDLAGVIRLKK